MLNMVDSSIFSRFATDENPFDEQEEEEEEEVIEFGGVSRYKGSGRVWKNDHDFFFFVNRQMMWSVKMKRILRKMKVCTCYPPTCVYFRVYLWAI